MVRRTLLTLSASALLSAALGATNPALAFPFGLPPLPHPGLGGLGVLHGLGAPRLGLAAPFRGPMGPVPRFAGHPLAGYGGVPRTRFGAHAGLGAYAGHSPGLSRVGGGSVSTRYSQSARAGYGNRAGYRHNGSRYGRWVRDGLYGSATSGYSYGSDSYSSSNNGCSYVYGYGYARSVVCSDN